MIDMLHFLSVKENLIIRAEMQTVIQHLEDHGLYVDFQPLWKCNSYHYLVDKKGVWLSHHGFQQHFRCGSTQVSRWKTLVQWHKGAMPGLDQRHPDEQIPESSRRWWMLWRSRCHIRSTTEQCTGTTPLPDLQEGHIRTCELQTPAISRWHNHIQRGEIQHCL